MNPDTQLTSKKYKTLGALLVAPIKSIILVSGKERNKEVRDYLCSWLYLNHYGNKPMVGNLTQRIMNLDNIPCYQYIVKNVFNNIDILKYNKSFRYILNPNCILFIKKIHSIEPRLNGSFLDYLIRRMICDLLDKDFQDTRTTHVCQKIIHVKDEDKQKEEKEEDKQKEGKEEDKQKEKKEEDLNVLIESISTSYTKCKNISLYKSKDILKDIFMTSLSHSIYFGWQPNKTKIDSILNLLSDGYEILTDSLKVLCEILLERGVDDLMHRDILLNPDLGYNIPELNKSIPADCDMIINNIIYDIKCTKDIGGIYELLQLLGYSALVDCSPSLNKRIEHVSTVNLLQGCIVSYDITAFNKEHMLNYLRILTK
jgi:hypothetical protein